MKKFIVTFGSNMEVHRNDWVSVLAEDEEKAREKVFERFSKRWSMLYPEDKFKYEYFPGKEVEVL